MTKETPKRELDENSVKNLEKVKGKIQHDNKHFHLPNEKY